jgi:hypothetical protein
MPLARLFFSSLVSKLPDWLVVVGVVRRRSRFRIQTEIDGGDSEIVMMLTS